MYGRKYFFAIYPTLKLSAGIANSTTNHCFKMPKEILNLSSRQIRRRIKKAKDNVKSQLNQQETCVENILGHTVDQIGLSSDPDVCSDNESFNDDVELRQFENCESDDEKTKCQDFKSELQNWSISNNIPHSAINDLLSLLKQHLCFNDLPKDARSLLQTRRSFEIRNVLPGKYVHFGLENGIRQCIINPLVNDIQVFIGIDGIPVSKSSRSEFWPILCCIKNIPNSKPFCIGLYHGQTKPADQNDYLIDFIKEVKILQENGIEIGGRRLNFQIKAFICDAPARAFITCSKYHSGFSACSKCKQIGERYENRTVFSNKLETLRSDEEFGDLEDEHYRGTTILRELNIGLVSSVPSVPVDKWKAKILQA